MNYIPLLLILSIAAVLFIWLEVYEYKRKDDVSNEEMRDIIRKQIAADEANRISRKKFQDSQPGYNDD